MQLVVKKASSTDRVPDVKEWWIVTGGVLYIVTETGPIAYARHAWWSVREER